MSCRTAYPAGSPRAWPIRSSSACPSSPPTNSGCRASVLSFTTPSPRVWKPKNHEDPRRVRRLLKTQIGCPIKIAAGMEDLWVFSPPCRRHLRRRRRPPQGIRPEPARPRISRHPLSNAGSNCLRALWNVVHRTVAASGAVCSAGLSPQARCGPAATPATTRSRGGG